MSGSFLKIMLGAFVCSGCVSAPPHPRQTQLQIREFQTRTYYHNNTRMVMKAMLNVLQDEGFIVKNADKELGFISASKEVDVEEQTEAFLAQLFNGAAARYRKNSVIDCSVNVTEFGRETKVRIIFQNKVLDNFGSPVQTFQVEDPKYYQDFFAKVDKSIFLEKEAL